MSAPGKVCLVTVRDDPSNPWCERPGVGVVAVPATGDVPAYELTYCREHRGVSAKRKRRADTVVS